MTRNRRFKTKKTANTNRIKTDEVLKIDLNTLKVAIQNRVRVAKEFVVKLHERGKRFSQMHSR